MGQLSFSCFLLLVITCFSLGLVRLAITALGKPSVGRTDIRQMIEGKKSFSQNPTEKLAYGFGKNGTIVAQIGTKIAQLYPKIFINCTTLYVCPKIFNNCTILPNSCLTFPAGLPKRVMQPSFRIETAFFSA